MRAYLNACFRSLLWFYILFLIFLPCFSVCLFGLLLRYTLKRMKEYSGLFKSQKNIGRTVFLLGGGKPKVLHLARLFKVCMKAKISGTVFVKRKGQDFIQDSLDWCPIPINIDQNGVLGLQPQKVRPDCADYLPPPSPDGPIKANNEITVCFFWQRL